MKKIIIILFVQIVLAPYAIAQGIADNSRKEICDSNYIRTYSFTATNAKLYNLSEERFDGLGRKSKSVNLNFAPNNTHIISSVAYDENGREWKNFLPVTHNDRSSSNSLYGEESPFSEIIYEASPLNRIVTQYGPGAKWRSNGKAVRTLYFASSNENKDSYRGASDLLCYRLVYDSENGIIVQGFWPSGALSVTKTIDENGNEEYLFKDEFDHTVLKRRKLDGKSLDTYMVYDTKKRLVAVLPPMASVNLASQNYLPTTDDSVRKYAYLYMYDERNRCIAKKLPGCDWTYYIYDKGDRLIFKQDPEQRKGNRWTFSIPDTHGRVCLTGTCVGDRSVLMQDVLDTNIIAKYGEGLSNTYMGYSISGGISWESPVILSVSYYDDYSFINNNLPRHYKTNMGYMGNWAFPLRGSVGERYNPIQEFDNERDIAFRPIIITIQGDQWQYVQGRLTGTAERIIGEEITNDFKWSAYYYDRKGNIIQTRTTRANGGIDVTSTFASFTGKPIMVNICHNYQGENSYDEYYDYVYDNWDRLLRVRHMIGIQRDCDWTTVSDIEYDAIGRVISDKRNGDPGLKTTYSYNVRSWTKGISGPGCSEELFYEPDSAWNGGENEKEQWNGNISSINYDYICEGGSALLHHRFSYDALSRLVSSTTEQNDDVTQETYTYDAHTNMISYKRTGASPASRTMSYAGNRMTSVETPGAGAGGGAIRYDAIGRIVSSDIEGMTEVKYNVMGYPSFVGQAAGGYVHHTYTAGGARMASRRTDAAGVMTLMEYEGNEVRENGKLRMLLFDGGYVDFSSEKPRYCWYTKDHLGSVRAVADGDGNVFATYAYRPYGEEFAAMTLAAPVTTNSTSQNNQSAPVSHGGGHLNDNEPLYPTVNYSPAEGPDWQPFKFSGKESLARVGLDLYDFGARMYSPSNMRWMTMDPLCEKHFDISPYVYCFGNPSNVVDPDGRDGIYVTFPQYKANGIPFTGHAGVLLINNKTGFTKYYEYGRYDKENRGIVRSISVSNVKIGKDGKPTNESLNKVMKQLSVKAGHNGDIEGAYIISDEFDKMNDYAKSRMHENDNPDREDYSVLSNNCATFAEDVITQDKSVDKPFIIINSPINIVDEYQEEGNARVQYKSKTQTTTVDKGNEKDAKKGK